MDVSELKSKLPPYGTFLASDATYAVPTKRWLLDVYGPFYRKWTFDHDLLNWRDVWDCDDFAALYRILASACHAKTNEGLFKERKQGLAVGEFSYRRIDLKNNTSVNHALNVALTDEGLVFIEPQTMMEATLSEDDIRSCWFMRF